MKKLMSGILGLVGLGAAPAAEAQVTMVDPSTLLFSMSTLAGGEVPVEAAHAKPGPSDLVLHEDEWRQIEFLPASRLSEIQAKLRELVSFEREHRVGAGWNKIFERRLADLSVLASENALASLSTQLGITVWPAPFFFYGNNVIVGRLAHGFTFALGGGVSLYGTSGATGVMTLCANVRSGGDDMILAQTFMKLSAAYGLIAVDWRSHMLLVGVTDGGQVQVWRP